MDILSRYIIRKTSKGRTYDIPGSFIIISLVFTIVSPILLIILIIKRESFIQSVAGEVNLGNESRNNLFIKLFPVFVILCLGNTMFLSVKMLKDLLKINNTKKLKKIGGGIVKKIQISSIERYQSYKRNGLNGYYLEAKDGDEIYFSDGIQKGEIEGVYLNPNLSKIYKKYGYKYDKNETHKQDVLNEIAKHKNGKKYETQNGGFLKNLMLKGEKLFEKDEKEIVEKGYQHPYLIVNGRKISVGDIVDIYINPENPKYYRMDTDFIFEK